MSLLVAIQSAIFYYVACTPCNEARARYKTKRQAKMDREEKIRIQMEQPGLYRHPSPFHTNPYWQEEIDIGPRPPKSKTAASRNTSQRGLNSSSTERNSTSASLTCTSSHNELSSIGPASPTIIPEDSSLSLEGSDWNRRRYQREDEELWGHDFSRMGHKLVDNIVKAGSSAGRMIKGELAPKDKSITEEDRTNFYLTPKNPPVNDYHPPIVGSAPAHKNALQWMLQPPPPAKIMEGKVPVGRAQSFNSSGSRRSHVRKSGSAKPAVPEDQSLDRAVRERQARLRNQETPSEAELIDVLIGRRSRQTTVSSRGRSMSIDSEKASEPSTDSELVDRRWRPMARPSYIDSDDSAVENDADSLAMQGNRDSPSRGRGTARAAQRPKLGTIRASNSTASRKALSNIPNGSTPESGTPRATSPVPVSQMTSVKPLPLALAQAKDENAPIAVAS